MALKFCQEITNKEIWENLFLNCREKTFLQSWRWGEFQKMMGNKIWRLGVYDNEQLVAAVLLVKIQAKRGTFLLVQHGPNIKNFKSQITNSKQIINHKFQILNVLLEKFKEIAKKENCSFIRIAPLWERNKENIKIFKNEGFRQAPMHASAYEATLKLDLTSSEEELLTNMRKTTRYLIRQAVKNPKIEIVKSNQIKDTGLYQTLNEKVAHHQKFTTFSFEFVKNEFEVFAKDNQALLFFAKYQGEVTAAALIIFWSGIGFYHHAALDPKYHRAPLAYLLQWEAIKEAKKRGCKFYDFWGYYPKPDHPWAGPTLFKKGFGGEIYEYLKTQDLPLSKKYWLTWAFEKIRSKKRGL